MLKVADVFIFIASYRFCKQLKFNRNIAGAQKETTLPSGRSRVYRISLGLKQQTKCEVAKVLSF